MVRTYSKIEKSGFLGKSGTNFRAFGTPARFFRAAARNFGPIVPFFMKFYFFRLFMTFFILDDINLDYGRSYCSFSLNFMSTHAMRRS